MQGLAEIVALAQQVDNNIGPNSLPTVTAALEKIDQLFQDHPTAFIAHFDQTLYILQRMNAGQIDASINEKIQYFDLMGTVISRNKNLAVKNPQRLEVIYKAALDLLVALVTEPTQEWANPPNGFIENGFDDREFVSVRSILQNVDCLSEIVGFNQTILYLQPLLLQYIQNNENWKYKYAALMVGSQAGIQGSSVSNLALFVQWGFSASDHPHPKVRMAAMHLIGQLADDLNPEFAETFFTPFFNLISNRLQDNVPRVVSYTMACAANFFDECDGIWMYEHAIGILLNMIGHLATTSRSWLVQNSLSMLSSFTQKQGALGPNLPNALELCFKVIDEYRGNEEWKQVVELAIDVLGMAFSNQKRHLMEPYLPRFVNTLFTCHQFLSPMYFLRGWIHLCEQFGTAVDLKIYFPIIKETFQKALNQPNEEESTTGVKAITATFACFKIQTAPYAIQMRNLAKSLFEDENRPDQLRQASLDLLCATITEIRPQSQEQVGSWMTLPNQFSTYLIDTIKDRLELLETIFDIPMLLETLKKVIKRTGNCFAQNELLNIADKLLNMSADLEGHLEDNNQLMENGDTESNEESHTQGPEAGQVLDNCLDLLPDCLREVVNLLTLPQVRKAFLQKINQFIKPGPDKTTLMNLFSLDLMLLLQEKMTYWQVSFMLPKFLELYSKMVVSGNPRIRNSAIYGIGLVLRNSPQGAITPPNVSQFLNLAVTAFSSPFEENSDKFYLDHCKDNTYATVGWLINGYLDMVPPDRVAELVQYWLQGLPLNTDLGEGNDQQRILIELLKNRPCVLVQSANDLVQICSIFSRFVVKRQSREHKEILDATINCMLMLREWPLFMQQVDYLWSRLSESQRSALSHLINNPI